MDYKLKYLKYKHKYVELKKITNIQFGGNNFTVIPNSGAIDGMSNQCMWISIRDYLQNYRNINISVRELREYAGLDQTTEHTQFDWETPEFRRGIERVCEIFSLQLNCYLVDHNGQPNKYLFHDPETKQHPMPMQIINERGHNIVNIAFYGAHFQLITSGFGMERFYGGHGIPEKAQPIKMITFYENKEVDDKIKEYYDQIIENEQIISALEYIISKLILDIKIREKNLSESESESDVFTHIREITETEIINIQEEIEMYYKTIDECKIKIKEAHENI